MTRWTIYCHTSPSGKQYIGQTKLTMEERWALHLTDASRRGKGRCEALRRAVHKHGADAFTHEILDVVTTQVGANIAERLWIEKRGTLAPGGYNLTTGGDVFAFSEETLKRMSDSARKRWAAVTPERRAETGRKMSESARKRAASMTPEERADSTRAARKGFEKITPERHSEIAKKRSAAWPTELRERLSKVYMQEMTAEQRSEATTRGIMAMSPEARRARSLKGAANRRAKAAAAAEKP